MGNLFFIINANILTHFFQIDLWEFLMNVEFFTVYIHSLLEGFIALAKVTETSPSGDY